MRRVSKLWQLLACACLLSGTAAHAQPSSQRLYAQGVAARLGGDQVQAVRLLRQVVKAQPSNADAQLQLGLALLASGRLDSASAAFRRTLQLAPRYDDARVGLARVAQRRGRFADALAELQRIRAPDADAEQLRAIMSLALRYEEGVAARHGADHHQAILILRRVVEAQPAHADARLQLGLAQLALSHLQPAADAFHATLQAAPDYVDARIALSRVAQRRGDIGQALTMLNQSRVVSAEGLALRDQLQQQALYDEGVAARRIADYPRAVSLFRHLVQLKPDHADGQLQLGLSLFATKNIDAAEAAFRQTLTIAPHYADARLALLMLEQERRSKQTGTLQSQ